MKLTANSITVILLFFGLQTLTFGQEVTDDFSGNGSLIGYTTNNPTDLPDVTRTNDRYRANLTDNAGDITLHFNNLQGRLDAKLVAFPFEYIARNIGIGTQADSQLPPIGFSNPYIFAGIQVHVPELESRNSSHIVVGHRGGSRYFTVEGKNTVNGDSEVNDEGANVAPDGRADLRVVGNADNTLTVSWQLPGTTPDNWILYRTVGNLPPPAPVYGDSVYIGLITYAQGSQGVPFVGTCDGIEFSSSAVLPISLLDFEAVVKNEKIQLNWSTTSETNNDFFTIERSKNASVWEEIARVDGAGNSSQVLSYTEYDDEPLEGTVYYRLKQTDFDGKFAYSNVESVKIFSLYPSVFIYPNPAENEVIIKGNNRELSQMKIHTVLGQDVTFLTHITGIDELSKTIDISRLKPGLYTVITKNTANKLYKK